MSEPADVGVIRADERSAAFFAAAARDVLLIRRCAGCRRWLDPAATACTGCGADDPPWEPSAGRGTLISWAVLPGEGTSILALVELDEGPWLRTRLVADPAAVAVGLAVRARFEHPAEGESYPLFWPSAG
jgi:uncharacterized OB-fold protein